MQDEVKFVLRYACNPVVYYTAVRKNKRCQPITTKTIRVIERDADHNAGQSIRRLAGRRQAVSSGASGSYIRLRASPEAVKKPLQILRIRPYKYAHTYNQELLKEFHHTIRSYVVDAPSWCRCGRTCMCRRSDTRPGR